MRQLAFQLRGLTSPAAKRYLVAEEELQEVVESYFLLKRAAAELADEGNGGEVQIRFIWVWYCYGTAWTLYYYYIS